MVPRSPLMTQSSGAVHFMVTSQWDLHTPDRGGCQGQPGPPSELGHDRGTEGQQEPRMTR